MGISKRSLGLVGLAVAFSAMTIFYMIETNGWNSPIKTEYSPRLKTRESDMSEITLQVLSSWEGASVFTITLKKDGSANYVGVRNAERVGNFEGKTEEFAALAGWIQSLNLEPFQEKCFDNEVRLILVRPNSRTEYITCDPNRRPEEFRDALDAIEKAGARIRWTD
jgi:hypothetical protein